MVKGQDVLQTRNEPRHVRVEAARGFSLVELIAVIVIVATLAVISVPRFSNSLALQRVEAAARRIIVDLAFAQRHAKSSNVAQTVRFDPVSGEYSLVGMPHPDHPSLEYKVFLKEEPYGVVLVSADFGSEQEIIFDIYGMPDSGGSVVIRVGSQLRTIVVDADSGKASAQKLLEIPMEPLDIEELPVEEM